MLYLLETRFQACELRSLLKTDKCWHMFEKEKQESRVIRTDVKL